MVRPIIHHSKNPYSVWHRKRLPNPCYVCDVDMIEFRYKENKLVPVAIMETKHWNGNKNSIQKPRPFQVDVYTHIAEKLEIPYYCVNYCIDENINQNRIDEDLISQSTFYVIALNAKAKSELGQDRRMDESEYRAWIEKM